MQLECLKIEPHHPAIGSIIWLHGLGADGHDFKSIAPQLQFDTQLPLRFIFPHAPIRPVSINDNNRMRAWFDIHHLGKDTLGTKGELITRDEQGIRQSQHAIVNLINEQIASGIPSEKIILAGFSQGGTMALYTGIHFEKPLAGILALSTLLPSEDAIKNHAEANAKTPILMLHGTYDPVIPLALAQTTYEHLKKANLNVSLQEYPMEHQMCAEELEVITNWIKELYA